MKIIKIAQDVPVEEHQYDKMDKDKKDDIKSHLNEGSGEGLSLSEIAKEVNIERFRVKNYLSYWWSGKGGTGGERAKRNPPSTLKLNQAFPHLGNVRDILDKEKMTQRG